MLWAFHTQILAMALQAPQAAAVELHQMPEDGHMHHALLPPKLNILYVVLEDFGTLGSSVFRAYGGAPNGTTPNLQALARRGVTFQRAYANAPICNPSRASLLVGRRPEVTRVYSNTDKFDAHVLKETPHLVHFLRDTDPAASIACAGGKIFHEACDSAPRGFSLPRGPDPEELHDGRSNDEHKTEMAVKLLRAYAANRTRFFLALGLSATHVMRPAALCSERAAQAEGYTGVAATLAALQLPPARQQERRPPLVSWPNYDLKADASMRSRKRVLSALEARRAIGSYHA